VIKVEIKSDKTFQRKDCLNLAFIKQNLLFHNIATFAVQVTKLRRPWVKEIVNQKEENCLQEHTETAVHAKPPLLLLKQRRIPSNSLKAKDHKQLQVDKRYLQMAAIWAGNSYCERRKVGALIVKNKMIISDGYNGTPTGFENICEDEIGKTKSYVLHAEANAITKVAKTNQSSDGATLYITASPCIECAKLIVQAGIVRVVYADKYRSEEGLTLLDRAKVETEFIEI
jgi:dCMP deaminase